MTKYWNESYETLPREQLDALKLKRLKDTVQRVYERVPFYRTKFQEMGLDGDSVESLDDLKRLPFTTKPTAIITPTICSRNPSETSSASTRAPAPPASPSSTATRRRTWNMWAEIVARARQRRRGPSPVVQNAYGYGLFTGGLGIHGGAERLGASIIPISGGNTQKQPR